MCRCVAGGSERLNFDYEYFWKPLLIFALIGYSIRVYFGFWNQALKRRNEIYGTTNKRRDSLIPPFPSTEDYTDPRYQEYHSFFYPRFHYVVTKAAVGWLLVFLISFT